MQWVVRRVGLTDVLEHSTALVAGMQGDVYAGLMLCVAISMHDNSNLQITSIPCLKKETNGL